MAGLHHLTLSEHAEALRSASDSSSQSGGTPFCLLFENIHNDTTRSFENVLRNVKKENERRGLSPLNDSPAH